MEPAAPILYPASMPARPGFANVTWGMDSVVAVAESPFSFSQQVHVWPGQRWKCGLRLPKMLKPLALEWWAFFASLNGLEGTFLLSDSLFARKQVGEGLGHPETSGAQPAGATIVTKGWTPGVQVAMPGDWLEVAGRLRRVVYSAFSDGAGNATLTLWPRIAAMPTGAPIEWLNPRGIFRLAAEVETAWEIDRMMAGLQFACVEVL